MSWGIQKKKTLNRSYLSHLSSWNESLEDEVPSLEELMGIEQLREHDSQNFSMKEKTNDSSGKKNYINEHSSCKNLSELSITRKSLDKLETEIGADTYDALMSEEDEENLRNEEIEYEIDSQIDVDINGDDHRKLHEIPSELLASIFVYLPKKSISTIMLVCKTFKKIITKYKGVLFWKECTLSIDASDFFLHKLFRESNRFTKIQKLTIEKMIYHSDKPINIDRQSKEDKIVYHRKQPSIDVDDGKPQLYSLLTQHGLVDTLVYIANTNKNLKELKLRYFNKQANHFIPMLINMLKIHEAMTEEERMDVTKHLSSTDYSLTELSEMTQLDDEITMNQFDFFTNTLKSLQILTLDLNDASVDLLAKTFPALETFNIWGCDKITDYGCESIGKYMNNLKHLEIGAFGIPITTRGLIELSRCKHIEYLNLRRCTNTCLTGMRLLVQSMTKLSYIDFRFVPYLNDEFLVHLSKHCPKVQTLLLRRCKVSFENPELFEGHSLLHLKTLDLTETDVSSLKGVVCFAPNLESLTLDLCDLLNHEGIVCLPKLTKLKHFSLQHTYKIIGTQLCRHILPKLRHSLTSLHLQAGQFTPIDIIYGICRLVNLTSLSLHYAIKMDDTAFSALLKALPRKKFTTLTCTRAHKITVRAASELAEFPYLNYLDMHNGELHKHIYDPRMEFLTHVKNVKL
mmetsp:Transcript_9500/g.14046  ORF Transcript_9500/g.14046 Transcript_9500/m.14046 type:complete len:685 (+) Transcript_9500:167-2221(+)